jgi:hypothetical protein
MNSSPPTRARQTPRYLAQQRVANQVAMQVVDFLEAVEIEAQNRKRPAGADRLVDRRRKIVGK